MVDQKLTQLTEDASPTTDDLIYIANDPAGTPASKKVTLANLITLIHANPTVGWTPYHDDSTIVGWSSFSEKFIYYIRIGGLVCVQYNLYGVSNSVSTNFTLPYTNNGTAVMYNMCMAQNNGVTGADPAALTILNGDAQVVFYKTLASGSASWTASGNKGIWGEFWYYTTQAP